MKAVAPVQWDCSCLPLTCLSSASLGLMPSAQPVRWRKALCSCMSAALLKKEDEVGRGILGCVC